jgi:hypothetical protein
MAFFIINLSFFLKFFLNWLVIFTFVQYQNKLKFILLLNLFRTNQFLANILLVFYIALLRGGLLFNVPPTLPIAQGIWSYELYNSLENHLWLLPHLAAALVFFQAVGVNYIATRYRLSEEITLWAGVFYILLTSSVLELAMPTSTLLSASFLIIILFSLFETYRQSASAAAIFNIGLWIAVGSFFQFAFGVFILLAVIGLNVLRAYNFREILMLLIGVLTAYFMVGAFYFYFDAFDIFWNQQVSKNIAFFNIIWKNNWVSYLERIFFGLLLGLSILSQGMYSFKKSIQVQKFQTVLFWTTLVAGVTVFFQTNVSMEQMVFVMPPLAFFMMYNFLKMERGLAEALHLLWIFFVIALQFHQNLGF